MSINTKHTSTISVLEQTWHTKQESYIELESLIIMEFTVNQDDVAGEVAVGSPVQTPVIVNETDLSLSPDQSKTQIKPDFVRFVTPRRRPAPPPGIRTPASEPPTSASADIVVVSGEYNSSDDENPSSGRKLSAHKRIPRRDSFVLMKERTLKMKHLASKTKSFFDTKFDANVVIDTGSHCLRAGFAGDNMPISQFRNVVARKPCAVSFVSECTVIHLCVKHFVMLPFPTLLDDW